MSFVGLFQAGVSGICKDIIFTAKFCPFLLNSVGIGATNVHIYEIYDIMLLLSAQDCRGKLV